MTVVKLCALVDSDFFFLKIVYRYVNDGRRSYNLGFSQLQRCPQLEIRIRSAIVRHIINRAIHVLMAVFRNRSTCSVLPLVLSCALVGEWPTPQYIPGGIANLIRAD